MESLISLFVSVMGIYLLIGVLFATIFLFKAITKVDPVTEGSSFFFKLLIFPGLVFLWPFLLSEWIKTK